MMFEVIIEAETARDMIGYALDNHLELGTNSFEASVPAVSVIVAALAGELSSMARGHFLPTLGRMVSGESYSTEAALGHRHLGDECRARCREGCGSSVRSGLPAAPTKPRWLRTSSSSWTLTRQGRCSTSRSCAAA